MTRFVVGDDRSQSTLFPERLDDYVGDDNPVRAIDVFVDELDLGELGFGGVEPRATGRPAYHPATLASPFPTTCLTLVGPLPYRSSPVSFSTRKSMNSRPRIGNWRPNACNA
jgi:hypothetical protein